MSTLADLSLAEAADAVRKGDATSMELLDPVVIGHPFANSYPATKRAPYSLGRYS